MNREDEIRKRLESFDRQPPVADIRAVFRADLRYLLEKVERLERERLVFVSAEEAAKWPEGCNVLCALSLEGRLFFDTSTNWHGPKGYEQRGYTAFARLPETLPELEGKDG